MANITITFPNALPVGIQVTDIAWYADTSANTQIKMGPITSISGLTIVVNASAGVVPPATDDFIFYAKDPMTDTSSLKGYYAEAQFVNNSTSYGELFSVGTEIFESSK